MQSPVSTQFATTMTTVVSAIAPSELVLWGIETGLRSEVLLAGFCGSIVAMVMLNSVPHEGTGWQGVMYSAGRRFAVAVASCLTAGYLTAGAGTFFSAAGPTLLSAFVIGAGAQTILQRAIAAFGTQKGA